MSDLVTDLIHVEDEFRKHPEHFSWIADLQAAWRVATNRIDSDGIEWNVNLLKRDDITKTFHFAGIRPDDESPELTNRVFCVGEDGKALSTWFGSPVLLSHDKRNLDELLGYEIKKVNGEKVEKDVRLADIFTELNLPQHTPVYSTVFFLPVSLKGAKYETHFFPMVLTPKYEAANYLIVENNLVAVGQVSNRGPGRQLMAIDKDEKEFYHKATFTPDAAADGKIIVPAYEGRMILIAKPIKVQQQLTPFKYGGYDFRPSDFYDTQPATFGGTRGMKSAQVDTVSISQGMESKSQSAKVEAEQDFGYLPTILDIRCLGVRRGIEMMYLPDKVKAFFKEAYAVPTMSR